MSSIDFLVKLRDAACMIKDACEEYLAKMAPDQTKGSSWNPERIKWEQAQGSSGPYEKSEDVNSLDFKTMLKDLASHQGKLQRDGYFYWAFQNGSTVGRKRKTS